MGLLIRPKEGAGMNLLDEIGESLPENAINTNRGESGSEGRH